MDRLPDFFLLRQQFDAPRLDDPEGTLLRLLARHELSELRAGDRVGITAGSRGITDGPAILRALASFVKDRGAAPFLVPCMGSHGGATSEGQIAVLAGLGITERTVGAPILSSMEVREIGKTAFGTPIVVDENMCRMDRIIVANRVAPHTDFGGDMGSGLAKMSVVGMGKHTGASLAHRLAMRHGFPAVLAETAPVIADVLPIMLGVAIIENPHHETAHLEMVTRDRLVERDKALLRKARGLMPRLPFAHADLLVVDEIGKNISGTGMDPNIVGRCSFARDAPSGPTITRIFVRSLTDAAHGNATGIGRADYTTKRLVAAMDPASTQVNSITSMTPEDARVPISFDRDADAIRAAYETCGAGTMEDFRVLWIRNTARLEYVWASRAYLDQARDDPRLQIAAPPCPLPFDQDGDLVADWSPRSGR